MTLTSAPLPDLWSPLVPWRQAAERARIRAQLTGGHKLAGQRFLPYAECDRCDAVVVEVPDGRHALVLPFRSPWPARPPDPRTTWLGGPAAAAAAMRAHAAQHTAASW